MFITLGVTRTPVTLLSGGAVGADVFGSVVGVGIELAVVIVLLLLMTIVEVDGGTPGVTRTPITLLGSGG